MQRIQLRRHSFFLFAPITFTAPVMNATHNYLISSSIAGLLSIIDQAASPPSHIELVSSDGQSK